MYSTCVRQNYVLYLLLIQLHGPSVVEVHDPVLLFWIGLHHESDVAVHDVDAVVVLDLHDLVAGIERRPSVGWDRGNVPPEELALQHGLEGHVQVLDPEDAAALGAQHLDIPEQVVAQSLFEHGLVQVQQVVQGVVGVVVLGLMRFLATSKRFKGVGEVRARELVKRFGEDFDRVVVDEPERLCQVRGISHEIADGIREEWLRRRQQANAITFLAAFGLTPYQVDKLLEAFGDSAVQVVRDNPYILMEKVDGFGFRRADEVALKTGVLRTNPHRIRAGLLYAMQKASEDGNTCLSRPDFLRQAVDLLVLDDDDAFDRVREALAILVEGGELVEFQGADERPYVALAFLYKMEMAIAAIFRNRGGCSVR